MRPTAQHSEAPEEPARVIYLGDVRRRRTAGQRGPDRHYLAALALIAGAATCVWLGVLFTLAPARLLTYAAFFAPLSVALTAIGAIGAYAVEWRRGIAPSLRACTRRGALSAAVVVANLALLAAHRWIIPVGVSSVMVAVIIDVVWQHRASY